MHVKPLDRYSVVGRGWVKWTFHGLEAWICATQYIFLNYVSAKLINAELHVFGP